MSENPVTDVAAIGDTPKLPRITEGDTFVMPALARITKLLLVPSATAVVPHTVDAVTLTTCTARHRKHHNHILLEPSLIV
jgi:hypothetical protein